MRGQARHSERWTSVWGGRIEVCFFTPSSSPKGLFAYQAPQVKDVQDQLSQVAQEEGENEEDEDASQLVLPLAAAVGAG